MLGTIDGVKSEAFLMLATDPIRDDSECRYMWALIVCNTEIAKESIISSRKNPRHMWTSPCYYCNLIAHICGVLSICIVIICYIYDDQIRMLTFPSA